MKELLLGCLGWIVFSLIVTIASAPWLYLFLFLGMKEEGPAFFGAIGLGIATIIGGSFGFRALGK